MNFQYNCKNELKLTSEFRRHIFFILKEILTNICKHSHATVVDMSLNQAANEMHFEIKDNGIGFKIQGKNNYIRHGKGIQNIESRVKALGGGIQVRNVSEGGMAI